jgi:cholesterol oxidase
VIDGSAIAANLGVNPALTITALSERAVALWPNKGESDPRPALGSTYQRVSPVRPRNPIVPESAPGALRLWRSSRSHAGKLPGYQLLIGCFGAGGCAAGTLQQ